MELTCESLGITPEEIADKVAQKIADNMLDRFVGTEVDADTGETVEHTVPTRFRSLVEKAIATKVERAVDSVCDRILTTELAARIDELKFPQTNYYGEKKAEPLTLLEFVANRANTFLTERVDMNGKTRAEGGYSDTPHTRIAWMVGNHLHYTIQNAINEVLKDANAHIVGGIEETVKIKLREVTRALKVSVAPKC